MEVVPTTKKQYVEQRGEGYWIQGTRISLDVDQEVLAISAQAGRVLVTHDRKTMPTEFGEFVTTQTSAGVLILSQKLTISDAIEALVLVWEASTAQKWVNAKS